MTDGVHRPYDGSLPSLHPDDFMTKFHETSKAKLCWISSYKHINRQDHIIKRVTNNYEPQQSYLVSSHISPIHDLREEAINSFRMYRKNSNSREYLAETFLAGSATTFTVAAPRVDPPFPTFSRKRLRPRQSSVMRFTFFLAIVLLLPLTADDGRLERV
ncbi:1-phosphatidylinositol 3-phosphate 5-kinase FAB1 [Fusarium oxysporum f. sp. albedinis]|nr:1-phosphatidylinositol 3-phosphate 5-kinase FAB1 [Fusarium oxysporum f. sp. albedinis]